MRKKLFITIVLALAFILLLPTPAYAMHIAEGILPANWAALWFVPAIIVVGIGTYLIKKQSTGMVPLLGLAGAAIFLISVFPIPVPIAGTSSHPAGTPLGAILVGPFASAVLGAIALLLQALFLAHGGLSTWGANIVSMAVVGSFVGYGAFFLFRKLGVSVFVAAFAAGLFGDWATYAVTAFELASALHGSATVGGMFVTIVIAFAPTQLPLGILEGLFTGGVAAAIYQRRPELVSHTRIIHALEVKTNEKSG